MRVLLLVACLLMIGGLANATPLSADLVVVKKSDRKIMLFSDGRLIKQYPISLGDNPVGHKVKKGDERTPEGRYLLTHRNSQSQFYKSIHVNYPNNQDRRRAYSMGVSPGGDIKIHGLPNKKTFPSDIYMDFNWTDGCIAVTDQHMDEIWSMIRENTPIEILP